MWLVKSLLLLIVFALIVVAGLGASGQGLKQEYPQMFAESSKKQEVVREIHQQDSQMERHNSAFFELSKACNDFFQAAARTVLHGVEAILD